MSECGFAGVQSIAPVADPYNSIYLQARLMNAALGRHTAVQSGIGSPATAAAAGPEIMLYHYGAFDLRIFAFAHRRRTAFVFHNVTPHSLLWRWSPLVAARALLAEIQLRMLPKGMPWIAVSRHNAGVLRKLGFRDVEHVPCIVEPIPPAPETPEPMLLFVGRICPSKNLIALLQVHRQVVPRTSARVRLVIVGPRKRKCRYADAFERELARCREAGLDVAWIPELGYRELRRLYAEAWVYVSASIHEGFGIPVVEAVMAGTPAVYLECGGTETVLENRGCCGADVADLVGTVSQLIGSAESRRRLADSQREVCAGVSAEAVGRRLYRYMAERFRQPLSVGTLSGDTPHENRSAHELLPS